VNGDLVFRMPNEAAAGADRVEVEKRNRAEVNLLEAVRGRLPVVTPEPACVAPDFGFFGYRYLPGAVLDGRDDLLAAPTARRRVVERWVGLVTTLAQIVPAERACALGLEPFARVRHRLDLVRNARAGGVFPPEIDRLATRVLEEYAERYHRAAESGLVTLHGDLGLSHWLVDEQDEPYAVIDWSDACLAPVEHEISNLYWTNTYARALVREAVDEYERRTDTAVDRQLVELGFAANGLGDIGLLVRRDPNDPDVHKVVARLRNLNVASAVPAHAIAEIRSSRPPRGMATRIVAVDGPGGAGKTSLSERLADELHAQIVHTDDFASWENPTDWWPALIEQVLEPLAAGSAARYVPTTWGGPDRDEVTVEPGEFVILDGVTASREAFRPYLAYSIWVETPRDVRLRRGLERDGEHMRPRWEEWMAAEDRYVEREHPAERADLVLPGDRDLRSARNSRTWFG
jgi:uridine kinase/aminoglycoside phosphotransferase (APT) family kinase protein